VSQRERTKYAGVFVYVTMTGDRIFYIRYRRDGKLIEEKAGRAAAGMTATKAARIRATKVSGNAPTNREERRGKKRPAVEQWAIEDSLNDLKGQINKLEKAYSDHIVKFHKNTD